MSGSMSNHSQFVKICVRIYLSYSGGDKNKNATNVSIVLSTPAYIHAVPKNFLLSKVAGL